MPYFLTCAAENCCAVHPDTFLAIITAGFPFWNKALDIMASTRANRAHEKKPKNLAQGKEHCAISRQATAHFFLHKFPPSYAVFGILEK